MRDFPLYYPFSFIFHFARFFFWLTLLPAGGKLFSKQTVFDGHLSGKKHVKAAADLMASQSSSTSAAPALGPEAAAEARQKAMSALTDGDKETARTEFRIGALVSAIGSVRADTLTNVERRLALTAEERLVRNCLSVSRKGRV